MTAAMRKNWMPPLKLLLGLPLYIVDAAWCEWFGGLLLLFARHPMRGFSCEFSVRQKASGLRGLLEERVDLVAACPRVLDLLHRNFGDMTLQHRSVLRLWESLSYLHFLNAFLHGGVTVRSGS